MTAEDIVRSFRGTVSPPVMYLRLNDAINHPDSSLAMIGRIIGEDSALSARLLRLVNSPFYGFPQRIETISDAVFLVGSHQVRDLALVTTMMNSFKDIPKELIDTQEFWLHSLACGVAAKILGEEMGSSDLERLFLLGVMHDIGRLVMYHVLPQKAVKMLQRTKAEGVTMLQAEKEALGFSHADIGKILTDEWRLPGSVQEVVLYHHLPGWAKVFPTETAIIHVADVLSHVTRLGSSGEPYVPMLRKESWDLIGIPRSSIVPLVERIVEETKAMAWLPVAA